MSTPSKKRKRNDGHDNSPVTSRSLDFFFGTKQRLNDDTTNSDAEKTTIKPDTPTDGLTDEELARKLQEEWAQEDDNKQVSSDAIGAIQTSHERIVEAEVVPTKQEESKPIPTQNAFAALGGKKTLGLQSATADEDIISNTVPFDQSPLTFDPQDYTAKLQQEWSRDDGSATYSLLVRCFVLINSTQSRIKIVDTLVNLLRVIIEADPSSLVPAVWLATNSISPPYIDLELGLGGSAISKALKKVCGLDNAGLKTLYNKYGDAGDVAFEAKKRQSLTLKKAKPLTIKSVFQGLSKIAHAKGTGCQEVKQRIVERLVQDARGAEESRYVVRTLVQHLRIGAVKTTMLIALSRAFMLSRPKHAEFEIKSRSELSRLNKQELAEVWSKGEEMVKACFARRPNYNDLVATMLEIGLSSELLIRCGLALHIPLRPMLGGITRDMGEMLTKLQGRDFSCEYKYDGQRAQVHCDAKGKVTIFSRHLEVMTDKYPDLVALVPQIRGEGVNSFIMEGEVVAIDRESHELRPFQVLTNRARKDVIIQSIKIDVCLFAFDLMYLNGEELLDRPFRERRSLLRSLFVELPGHFTWVKSLDATSSDGEVVSDFFKSALDIKCEGIMVKVLDNLINPDLLVEDDVDEPLQTSITTSPSLSKRNKSKPTLFSSSNPNPVAIPPPSRRKALLSTYEPDKRLDSWLKVKKDYSTTSDTIDLIPIGGWHGQGRKSAWWSPILLAARDPFSGSLYAVTKCMSGFTDAFYKANRERYNPDGGENVLSDKPAWVEYVGSPDVWFHPHEVWEVAFADVSLSPTYTAGIGLVSEERGLSLRFPRFLKTREGDKGIEEASTVDFLAELYRKQEARVVVGENGKSRQEKNIKEENEESDHDNEHVEE